MTSLESVYDNTKSFLDTYVDSTDKTKVDAGMYVPKSAVDILFIYIFDWRVVFFSTLFLSLVLAYILKVVFDYLVKEGLYNEYGLLAYKFFGHFIVLNAFIAVFTLSYYYAKKGHKGKKGPKGPPGPRGPQGKNETCDICTLKEKTMTRDDPEPIKHNLIDNSIYENINKYLPKKWMTYKYEKTIGNDKSCPKCVKTSFPETKHVNGIVANTNSVITSFQYTYDKKGKTKLLGTIVGNKQKKNNVKQIKCPNNSGIYKIQSGYSYSKKGITGLKIYCKDFDNGEDTTPEQNEIGSIQPEDKKKTAHCNNDISFLSGLGADFTKEQLNQLNFSKCSYKGI